MIEGWDTGLGECSGKCSFCLSPWALALCSQVDPSILR